MQLWIFQNRQAFTNFNKNYENDINVHVSEDPFIDCVLRHFQEYFSPITATVHIIHVFSETR